ncbi:MAG: Si-specific NAD(P)(+) transhydrogenase [Terriglobia bacterium]
MKQYDLVVIGSGPAGEKGAAQAAYFGKKVALLERGSHVGGACVNTGTIPSKTLRESALYFSGLRQHGLYGIDYSIREGLTVGDFMYRKDTVVEQERAKVRQNIANHHIDLIRGTASFHDAHTLRVETPDGTNLQLAAEVFLISTGSRPHRAPEIPFDDRVIFDSDSILGMDRIPHSMAIVGGGVIGCEYASIFTALGVKVALVDGRNRLLTFLDAELSELLRAKLSAFGLEFFLPERLQRLEREDSGIRMTLQSGKTIAMETALLASGRRGTVDGLALEKVGIAVNQRGHIQVNDCYQTSIPHIYAAGDVIGFPALASTSMEQARVAVCHAFNFQYKRRVASMLPLGIYTIPEISAVGETEESCREKKTSYAVGRARYANNTRGQIMGDTDGMLKLIFCRSDRRLLGVHAIGESATELVHLGLMVLEAGGGIDTFINSVFNYPTLSELYKYAAYDGLGNLAGRKLREG